MEKHVDKSLEAIAQKMMKETRLEKPSLDFTNSIMQQIAVLETKKPFVYKPLISKKAWALIGLVLIGFMYVINSENPSNDLTWFDAIRFESLFNNQLFSGFSTITLPKTLLYAIGFFGLMLCIQIPFLKHHFDKRFEA